MIIEHDVADGKETKSISLGPGKRTLNLAAVKYAAAELNLLAIYLTTVKVLYVCGALQVIPSLITLIEPLRRDRELHMTTIRNEHAYYSCISQVMSKIPFPVLPSPTEKGISHHHCMYVLASLTG